MQLQYASDLHLEFTDNEYYLRNSPLVPSAEVLILAGDIVLFRDMAKFNWFFDELSKNFQTVYWIAGNHEYYHYDFSKKRGSFCEQVRNNIWLVNDFAVTVENVRLILSTLWTDIKPNHAFAIERGINDFHLIRCNGHRLTADDLREEHQQSVAFIEQELSSVGELKKVVITHHVPTFINYPEQYQGDILNEAFAVNLNTLILGHQPDYWIYGHHHQNIPEFKLGESKLVTNQLGYVQYGENKLFDRAKILTV